MAPSRNRDHAAGGAGRLESLEEARLRMSNCQFRQCRYVPLQQPASRLPLVAVTELTPPRAPVRRLRSTSSRNRRRANNVRPAAVAAAHERTAAMRFVPVWSLVQFLPEITSHPST